MRRSTLKFDVLVRTHFGRCKGFLHVAVTWLVVRYHLSTPPGTSTRSSAAKRGLPPESLTDRGVAGSARGSPATTKAAGGSVELPAGNPPPSAAAQGLELACATATNGNANVALGGGSSARSERRNRVFGGPALLLPPNRQLRHGVFVAQESFHQLLSQAPDPIVARLVGDHLALELLAHRRSRVAAVLAAIGVDAHIV